MHHANGPLHRREQYIIRLRDELRHKSHSALILNRQKLDSIRHRTHNRDKMSTADDRNNNSNANAPRGRRGGGRAYRARARGRDFYFNLRPSHST